MEICFNGGFYFVGSKKLIFSFFFIGLFLDNVFGDGDAKIYTSDFDHAINGFAHRDKNTFKAFFSKTRFPNLRNSSRTRYMSNRDEIGQTPVSEV